MRKINISLQQAVIEAAKAAGEAVNEANPGETSNEEKLISYLKRQALATPGSFLTLLGKVAVGAEPIEEKPVLHIELVAPAMKEK